MEQEELLKKWLKGTLSIEEQEVFKKLPDHNNLERLANAMPLFKAPAFDEDTAFNAIKKGIAVPATSKVKSIVQQILPLAAILVLALSIVFAFKFLNTSQPTLHTTQVASQEIITLPDASTVQLNAVSTLSYNAINWSKEREITLNGEAFFKVAKGKTFTVKTNLGDVTVLGTHFNVKQHDDFFIVTCYEGAVKVTASKQSLVLLPGEIASLVNKALVKQKEEIAKNPSWTAGTSSFKSVPYLYVLKEFERQFNVTIVSNIKDDSQLFTGTFNHQNLEKALQTITLPLQYKYIINKNTVTLYGE